MTCNAVAGMQDWERRLFGLYNDCDARGARLAGCGAGAGGAIWASALPDLRSRLAAMPHFALRPLDEAQQREALQLRAAQRGIELAGRRPCCYLQRRFARDMAQPAGIAGSPGRGFAAGAAPADRALHRAGDWASLP